MSKLRLIRIVYAWLKFQMNHITGNDPSKLKRRLFLLTLINLYLVHLSRNVSPNEFLYL